MEDQRERAIFLLSDEDAQQARLKPYIHICGGGAPCLTETRGYPNPQNRSALELVVNSVNGFIPLWDEGVTLNWRFQETSILQYREPDQLKDYVRELFGQGLMAWGDAVPVRFSEVIEPWDFEIVLAREANCSAYGCSLASAFFPDAGQHEMVLFPTMFEQDYNEQVETMAHELGHIFGLRHFFAQVSETVFPSEIFGTHSKFTIMNYGPESRMTPTDRNDLRVLYERAWSGKLKEINGTPIQLMRPFSAQKFDAPPAGVFARNAGRDVK